MRPMQAGLYVIGAVLLALSGCANDNQLKPPVLEHQYVLPPTDDPRFSSYPSYPEKTLNAWPKKDPNADMGTPPPSFSRSGRGGPMP